MKRWIIVILLSIGAGFWLGRQTIVKLREAFFPTSPREAYVHKLASSGLTESALGRLWLRAGEDALAAVPVVTAPFREAGYVDPASPAAVAYRFRIRAGQRLEFSVRLEPPSNTLVFVDLFRVATDPGEAPDLVASADSGQAGLTFEARRDGDYILRVQPELLRGGRYTLTAAVGPTLAFPVAAAGVADVRSFWGAPRDGGARDHHGIDIFAPRGTPVVAATAGRVSRVGTTGIGGRVVWLRDEEGGQSLYYAHLDRQLVTSGQIVRRGDTLGLVGNSGNARTTPPHLHFGIYRRGQGPLDPLPFVRPAPGPPLDPVVDVADVGGWRRTAVEGARLRAAPDLSAGPIAQLGLHVPVHVLGAAGEWYRVRTPDGRLGFIAGRVTEPIGPLRLEAVGSDASLRSAPGEDGVEMSRVTAGEQVEVLGRSADQLWVRAGGRAGWLAGSGGR